MEAGKHVVPHQYTTLYILYYILDRAQHIMIRLAVLLSLFISYAVPLILTPAGPVQLIENVPARRQEGMSRTIRPNRSL